MDQQMISLLLSVIALLVAFYSFSLVNSLRKKQPAASPAAPDGFSSRQLQLQAYERLVLLAERIGIPGLVSRLNQPGISARDMHFETAGIPCVMNRAHEIYLYGMEVDWQDGLGNRGFTFQNPNASTTCGCGTSFAV